MRPPAWPAAYEQYWCSMPPILAGLRLGRHVAVTEHIPVSIGNCLRQTKVRKEDSCCEALAPGAQPVLLCVGSCGRQGLTAPANMPRKQKPLRAPRQQRWLLLFSTSRQHTAVQQQAAQESAVASPLPEGPPGTVR